MILNYLQQQYPEVECDHMVTLPSQHHNTQQLDIPLPSYMRPLLGTFLIYIKINLNAS